MLKLNKIHPDDCHELIKQIPDKSVDLVYIDLPYLFENAGTGTSGLAQRIKKLDNQLNKNHLTNGIDYNIFDEPQRVMKNTYIYIWCNKEQLKDIINYWCNIPDVNMNVLVWRKTNPVPSTNGNWLPDVEYCLVFKGKGTRKYNPGYSHKSKFYVSPVNKEDKKKYKHPTIKPLPFVKNHLLHSTNEGDIILDCYCGSGTTCVAAKELNRQFIGIEINKEYWKIANGRIKNIDANGQNSIFTFL
ncbi:MAG: DNA-methyltransferase [Erysipelotrichaceae bacterium]|jgi:DNA modification methylase